MILRVMEQFEKHKNRLAWLAVFLMPLKLSLTYIVLLPCTALWLLQSWRRGSAHPIEVRQLMAPFYIFLVAAALSAVFGLDPFTSIRKLAGLGLIALSVFLFFEVAASAGARYLLTALVAGQSLAASHSVLQGAFPAIPGLFLGKVTESGQLAISSVIAFGLGIYLIARTSNMHDIEPLRQRLLCPSLALRESLWGLINLILFCAAAFSSYLEFALAYRAVLASVAAASLLLVLWVNRRGLNRSVDDLVAQRNLLVAAIVPLLLAALLVNLKRGPWFGFFAGSLLLVGFYGRRYLIPVAVGLALIPLGLAPVRERLAESASHFFIAGGRAEIWDIGRELATRYPLGIGYDCSPVLTRFSEEIPMNLTHFHNNLLNLVVENGWIALAIFVWWLLRTLAVGLRQPCGSVESIQRVSIACAFLACQIAGLVEYNFGDAEVFLIALPLLGTLAFLSRPRAVRNTP